MTGAPFPLGSSVSYWLWGGQGMYGLHRIADPELGCIAVMGKNGNPADGLGPDGHTGVVVALGPGTITCIESRGHVGVCIKTRLRSDWDGFVRVDGMNRSIIAAMYVWESMYDALNGTVMHVTYYSGPGDNDHDGWPDRADIGDGNGIDCSGAVKLCMDYGYQHDVGQPPPPPKPQEARLVTASCYFPGDGQYHTFWIDSQGRLIHAFGHNADADLHRENMGDPKIGNYPDTHDVAKGITCEATSLGQQLEVRAVSTNATADLIALTYTVGRGWVARRVVPS